MRRETLSFIALALATLWSAPTFAACGLGAPGTTVRVAVGETGRPMLVHVPAGYRLGQQLPLVLLLHGSTGDGAAALAGSDLGATADRHGFLLAAPDGGIPAEGGFAWNIPGVPTVTGKVPGPGDPDDVAYLGATIDGLAKAGCIDPARVYATGISGGGRMASWLACVSAHRLAAIAPVVGLRAGNPLPGDPRRPDPATCRPSRPVAVIAFAGDEDRTNPIEGGGAAYWQYTMQAALERWATLDGCGRQARSRAISPVLTETRYASCRGGDVVGRIVKGRGHEWVADNEVMWAFFVRHRRR